MPRRPPFYKTPKPLGIKYLKSRSESTEEKALAKAERDAFYCDRRWRRCRLAFLNENPICNDCEEKGKLTEATIAHHIQERLQRPDIAYDWDNLMPLCSECHNIRHKSKNKQLE